MTLPYLMYVFLDVRKSLVLIRFQDSLILCRTKRNSRFLAVRTISNETIRTLYSALSERRLLHCCKFRTYDPPLYGATYATRDVGAALTNVYVSKRPCYPAISNGVASY